MNQTRIPVQNLIKTFSLGTLSLGANRNGTQESLTRMFILKKNGMEYVGQLRVSPDAPVVKIEVFNENYFDEFEQPQSAVLENLTQKVLSKVKKESETPESVKELIKDFTEIRELEDIESVFFEPILQAEERDIDVMFGRLNRDILMIKLKPLLNGVAM